MRAGRTPEELAKEFQPSAQSIRTWVRQADLDALAARLNNRPRKCLGYRTPAQCVALTP
ncbi:hypothetical protein LDL49_56235 [Nonomuraea sp. NEAU-L178]|nr:hypothetical protein [Nonomuraea aurantiaca]MCA2230481.1 hypothetical protein [Nonomuraea aurantiaca]